MTFALGVLLGLALLGALALVVLHRIPQAGRHSHAGRELRRRQLRHPSAGRRPTRTGEE